jgi:hypothetical protein
MIRKTSLAPSSSEKGRVMGWLFAVVSVFVAA